MGHLLPSRHIAADGRSALESGKIRAPGGARQLLPLIAFVPAGCAARHRQRLRRQFSGPANFPGPWRRPGRYRRRATSLDSRSGRPGQARLERPNARGGAQHPGGNDHDCGQGHGQHEMVELHHRGQRSDHRSGTVRRGRARLPQWWPHPCPRRRPGGRRSIRLHRVGLQNNKPGVLLIIYKQPGANSQCEG
jgi:hypothetical protein